MDIFRNMCKIKTRSKSYKLAYEIIQLTDD